MSDLVRDAPQTGMDGGTFRYPFAAAPDVIRAHQKDAYFQGVLLEKLSSVMRNVYGARFVHQYTTEARTFADLLYLGLTTLLGCRTLGEEYCDIVQMEDDTLRMPTLLTRAGYIISVVLFPYGLNRILPTIRRMLRAKLEITLARSSQNKSSSTDPSWSQRVTSYILRNLGAITSPSPIYALSLATFYFTGAYYHLSKRLWRLRYIFTRRLDPSEQRIGYEALGLLLALQLGVQAYSHIQQTYNGMTTVANAASASGGSAVLGNGVEVSLDPNSYASNNALLFDTTNFADPATVETRVRKVTNTPLPPSRESSQDNDQDAAHVRYRLGDGQVMSWIESRQQRKCTLCLEPMKDPSATTCGHVFCWNCIRDWLMERPECPLCRQECGAQHVLPLRG